MKIGAQFYTVREFCKTPEDVSETFKKIADIGYKYVQISGICTVEPEWLATELAKNGLSCPLTHTKKELLIEKPAIVAAAHDAFNCKHVGLGYHKFTGERENYEEFCRTYHPVAEALAASGKYFMYHNHASEFVKIDGKTVMEHLAEDFAPDIMGFTLDTYWVQAGGADPAKVIESLSGRVPCIHLKDYAFGPKMAVVGEGNINFDRVFEKARDAGTEYMFVEQDDCYGEDPFECLKRSYAYLKARGFE
ncbi:MAG: sugar phosphate isomerase/epimerase [Clostridia bacterium]|nr:sugar phosphate isomerase/epimerase [Clostridia bacterium]